MCAAGLAQRVAGAASLRVMPRTPRIFQSVADEPIPFSLTGDEVEYITNEDGTTTVRKVGSWEENFTAVGSAPPQTIVHVLSAVRIDTAGRASWQVPALIAYVETVLVPTDMQRWAALMSDKSRVVHASVLGDLVEYLNEELFGAPLARRTGEQSGRGTSQT